MWFSRRYLYLDLPFPKKHHHFKVANLHYNDFYIFRPAKKWSSWVSGKWPFLNSEFLAAIAVNMVCSFISESQLNQLKEDDLWPLPKTVSWHWRNISIYGLRSRSKTKKLKGAKNEKENIYT